MKCLKYYDFTLSFHLNLNSDFKNSWEYKSNFMFPSFLTFASFTITLLFLKEFIHVSSFFSYNDEFDALLSSEYLQNFT